MLSGGKAQAEATCWRSSGMPGYLAERRREMYVERIVARSDPVEEISGSML
jgi:hypothetical protein